MDRVHASKDRPFDEIAFAALAICAVNGEQRHIGVLHRESSESASSVSLLHLAWNYQLRNENPRATYVWIDVPIHPSRLRQVASICRQIWRANNRYVPFGLSLPNDCFDENTGRFLLGPTKHGLTCATFTLAVFDRAGLRLAQYETWPIGRSGDREWQDWVASELESNGAPPEHVDAVRHDAGKVARFRPEDVAGAATVTPLPSDFTTASSRAQYIVSRLPIDG
jgi:hypothetical protein